MALISMVAAPAVSQEPPPTIARFHAAQRTSIATGSAALFCAIALLSLVTCGAENLTRAGGPRAGCYGKVFEWLDLSPSRRVRQHTDCRRLCA